MGIDPDLAESVEEFIEKYEPTPWDRAMLRHLCNEARWAPTGGSSYCKLLIDLMERIKGGNEGQEGDEFDEALKALKNG